ncbi:TPA: omptin family outer membrane protease [Salmonella enterica subsp. enterica serovar Poona]|nr:omptin family outer membrane protease [Salmonella enterica]
MRITGSLNGSLSAGFLSGEAREREYEPEEGGHKVSQLKLKYNSVPVRASTWTATKHTNKYQYACFHVFQFSYLQLIPFSSTEILPLQAHQLQSVAQPELP